MSVKIQIFSIIISVVLFIFVFDLVRRKRLAEEYSIFWLLATMTIVLISIWKEFLFWISEILGVANAVSLLVLFLAIFFVIYSLHLSVQVTTLREQNRELIQWIGILREQVHTIHHHVHCKYNDSISSQESKFSVD